jgi:hypothetical protein
MLHFACPRCQKRLTAPDEQAGTRFHCPRCRQRMVLPGGKPEVDAAAPIQPVPAPAVPVRSAEPAPPVARAVADAAPPVQPVPVPIAAPARPAAQAVPVRSAEPVRPVARPAAVEPVVPAAQPMAAGPPAVTALLGPPVSAHDNPQLKVATWYYIQAGEQCGPVSWAQLRYLAAIGHLAPGDRVWTQGLADWTLASAVAGLGSGPVQDKVQAPSGSPRPALSRKRRKWVLSVVAGAVLVAAGLTTWWWFSGPSDQEAEKDPASKHTPPLDIVAQSTGLKKFLSGKWAPEAKWRDSSSTNGDLHPDRASRIALGKDISVAVPPGCVGAPEQLTLKKQSLAQKLPLIRYELQLSSGETRLKQPVTVTFPYLVGKAPQGVRTKAPTVYHVHRDGRWEALPARVDPVARTATVSIQSFSWLIPDFLASDRITRYRQCRTGAWSEQKDDVLTQRPVIRKVLAVPYCSQGDTNWCAAAALTMLLRAYGKPAHMWDVARTPMYVAPQLFSRHSLTAPITLRADPATALVKAVTNVEGLFKSFGLEVDQDYLGYLDWEGLNGYLIQCIDQNKPVMINLSAFNHAVVVVGYDRDNIYVNDPCGHLMGLLGKGPAPDWYTPSGKNDNPYIAFPISWDKWNEQFSNPIKQFWYGMLSTTCVTVPHPVPDNATLINLDIIPPNFNCLNISRRPARRAPTLPRVPSRIIEIAYWWNGLIDKGYGFSETYDEVYRRGIGRLCNSDAIVVNSPTVSNATGDPVNVTGRFSLDGKPQGVSANSVRVDARQATALVPTGPTSNLDFRKAPLRPGMHRLTYELLINEQVRDSVDFMVDHGPALVDNVRVRKVGDEDIEISWDANLEERALGLPLKFQIWRFPEPRLDLSPRQMDRAQVDAMALLRGTGAGGVAEATGQMLVAVVGPGVHRWRTKIPEPARSLHGGWHFGVTALDPESGLASPDCQFVKLEKTAPPSPDTFRLAKVRVTRQIARQGGAKLERNEEEIDGAAFTAAGGVIRLDNVGSGDFADFKATFKIEAPEQYRLGQPFTVKLTGTAEFDWKGDAFTGGPTRLLLRVRDYRIPPTLDGTGPVETGFKPTEKKPLTPGKHKLSVTKSAVVTRKANDCIQVIMEVGAIVAGSNVVVRIEYQPAN